MPDVSEKVTIKRCNPMEVVKKDCVVLDHLKVKSDPKKEKWSLAHSDGGGGGEAHSEGKEEELTQVEEKEEELTQMEEEERKLTQVEESGLGRDRWLRGGFSLIPSGINTNTHIQWRYAVFYCHQHKDSHISFRAFIFTIKSKIMVIKS